jgi:hypothetical protein
VRKPAVRAPVAPVVAEHKDRIELFLQTTRLPRAELKIDLANLVSNIRRTLQLEPKAAPA